MLLPGIRDKLMLLLGCCNEASYYCLTSFGGQWSQLISLDMLSAHHNLGLTVGLTCLSSGCHQLLVVTLDR